MTNDAVCLKYKTDQAGDVKLIEKFNNLFFRLMSCKNVEAEARMGPQGGGDDEKADKPASPARKGKAKRRNAKD